MTKPGCERKPGDGFPSSVENGRTKRVCGNEMMYYIIN